MSKVGLVCDSTCDLGPTWCAEHDVVSVPLKVLFGEQTYLDWKDMTPEEFFERLKASASLPKTSQPTPAEFSAAYDALAAAGADEIVSIHLSAALSGTCESARIAAGESRLPVRVVDTKLVTQATGLALKAAVKARDRGDDALAIERAAVETADRCRLFFVLDTLDYLVKGGRAGKAQGLAASLLNIKPVLTFDDGVVVPFKKARGRQQAFAELARQVAEDAALGPVRVAFLHASAPQLADELRAALDAAGAAYELDSIGKVGAVIGTYAGPNAVGLAYHPVL